MSIRPLPPKLRRALLDVTKADRPTDDILQLLSESETVFLAEVPRRVFGSATDDVLVVTLYCVIASEILKRIHDCLLLFDWVPAPILIPCWFSGRSSARYAAISELKLLSPAWTYIDQFTNIDWRAPSVEPLQIDLQYLGVCTYWTKLSRLCQIDMLVKMSSDTNKQKGLFKSAQKYVEHKVEELVKAKYGPDAVVAWSDAQKARSDPTVTSTSDLTRIPETLSAKWFIKGVVLALDAELQKTSNQLHTNPSQNRLARAFQFFSQAIRLPQPHRFVALAVCLETLLSTRRSEITFQIASRLSWLLEPQDYAKRFPISKRAMQLYDLRSRIVHGATFSISKLESEEEELLALLRRVFAKILGEDKLFDTFFCKGPKVCEEYLDSLNLGGQAR